jgi:uncharacterized protein YcfL
MNKLLLSTLMLMFLLVGCKSPNDDRAVSKSTEDSANTSDVEKIPEQRPIVAGKPSAPIEFHYEIPAGLKNGDVNTTTLIIIPTVDASQIEVTMTPYQGLADLSGNSNLLFTNVPVGVETAIELTVQLLNDVGYLTVEATITERNGKISSKVFLIKYGLATVTQLKNNSENTIYNNELGRSIILMPAEEK